MATGSVLELNSANWEKEVLQSQILTVVDFWHEKCPWCVKFNPVYDQVAEKYRDKIKFVKVNILANPENRNLAIHHGVMGTPTLIFFCGGRPVRQVVGFHTREQLEKTIDEMLESHQQCAKQSTPLKI
jgi:thioredoxin 1